MGVGFDLSVTYDEFGNWYIGGGPSLGLSWPISASVISGTTYDDLGLATYSEAEVMNILQGPSTSVTAGAGVVGNVAWNNPTILGVIPIPLIPGGGSSTGIGVGTPQIGIGETWGFKIPGVKWNPRGLNEKTKTPNARSESFSLLFLLLLLDMPCWLFRLQELS